MNSVVQSLDPAQSTPWPGRIARALAFFLAFCLLLVVGLSTRAAATLTLPIRQVRGKTPSSFLLPYQEVRFPARGDGARIAAWFIPHPHSRHAVILVHGKDGSRSREFSGAFPELGVGLHQKGFTVLMIDLRGHGESANAHMSFGLRERRDIQGAVDWLRQEGFQPGRIGVLGVSMGAGSSIGAAAEEPAIGAVVADCSYADIYPIIQQEWHRSSGLPDFLLPVAQTMGTLVLGLDVTQARPVDEIARIAPRRILLIHGIADTLIPVAHADQLKAANPSAELWKVDGAGHGGSYAVNPKTYIARVGEFFAQNLEP